MRRPLSFIASALAIVFAPLSPARADAPSPVLWEGVVHTPDGRPAGGASVVAYARPPAESLQPGDRLQAVARTVADDAGHFVLRAEPGGAVGALADDAGWTTFMVTATSPAGMSMAIDSLAWKPSPGFSAQSVGGHGRWVTTPADLFAPNDRISATSVQEDGGVEQHPAVLTMKPPKSGADFHALATPPYSGCGLFKSKDAGAHLTDVGELSLKPDWAGRFLYTNTKSTTFEIGLVMDGGGWSVAGTSSMSNQHTMASDGWTAAQRSTQNLRFQANMLYKRFTWICGDGNAGYFYSEQTIEPVQWTGSLPVEPMSAPEPGCSRIREHHVYVGSGRDFIRQDGASTTFGGAINNVEGFSGSVTSTVSTSVQYQWHNGGNRNRAVCPENDFVYKNTRVTTEA